MHHPSYFNISSVFVDICGVILISYAYYDLAVKKENSIIHPSLFSGEGSAKKVKFTKRLYVGLMILQCLLLINELAVY